MIVNVIALSVLYNIKYFYLNIYLCTPKIRIARGFYLKQS